MLKNKPTRKPGQDLTTVPTYTIPEASGILAVPSRTLLSWYDGAEPILRASGRIRSIHLLSYRDMEEAYRIYLLRERFGYSLQFLRRSMCNARQLFKCKHPLQKADAVKECLGDLVYDKPRRGDSPRIVTSLGHTPGQQFLQEVVDLFGERIVDGKFIFPWRFAKTDHSSRPVSVNPNIMSGRLVVTDTRILVSALVEGRKSGITNEDIAKDYGLTPDIVEKALSHLGLHQKAA